MYGNAGDVWFWFLWIGGAILLFSSFGNWGDTYRVHQRFGGAGKGAFDILDERFARVEIAVDEYGRMKNEIVRRTR